MKQEVIIFFELNGRFVVANAPPFLRWFDIGANKKAMKKTTKERLDELKWRRASIEYKGNNDFMDVIWNGPEL